MDDHSTGSSPGRVTIRSCSNISRRITDFPGLTLSPSTATLKGLASSASDPKGKVPLVNCPGASVSSSAPTIKLAQKPVPLSLGFCQ